VTRNKYIRRPGGLRQKKIPKIRVAWEKYIKNHCHLSLKYQKSHWPGAKIILIPVVFEMMTAVLYKRGTR
jgi:hypothetical protein